MQNIIYTHSIGEATRIIQLVNRMKWLKKDSSDNEQISIAESQPEPEQSSKHAGNNSSVPEPETIEQPVVKTQESSAENDDTTEIETPNEDYGQETPTMKGRESQQNRKHRKEGTPESDEVNEEFLACTELEDICHSHGNILSGFVCQVILWLGAVNREWVHTIWWFRLVLS
jgi:hypothetical protein